MVTLTCDNGHAINGNATLQCVGRPGRSTYFPVWNSSIPSCEEVEMIHYSLSMSHSTISAPRMFCNHPGNVSNGDWNSTVTSLGSSVTLICDDSYVINGSATLLCVTSSDSNIPTWNASVPTCQHVETESHGNEPKCDHPGNVSHGKWDSNITMLGYMITLTCDEGFVLTGSATLQCVASTNDGPSTHILVWNATTPSCQKIEGKEAKCEHPHNVPHGKWDSNTRQLGSMVTLDCDEGYVLNGSATLFCMASSNDGRSTQSPVWNASIPSCQEGKSNFPVLLISLIASSIAFITLLLLIITAWCHQRKKYKRSHDPIQIAGDMTGIQPTGPVNHVANATLSLYTMMPPVSHTSRGDGYPVPARAEDSAFDQDHIYQDADEVRRNVTEMQRISDGAVSSELSRYHGSSTAHLMLASEQSFGGQCLLETLPRKPQSGIEECEYDKLDSTGIGSVTSGRGTATRQVRLFDETEYNSLESAKGPASNCMSKRAESATCVMKTYTTEEERPMNSSLNGQSGGTLEWNASYDNSEYVSIDEANPTDDERKPTKYQPTSDNTFVEDSTVNTTSFPFSTAHHHSTPDEVLYDEVDSGDPDDITICQAPQFLSAFDSDDYSLLNSFQNSPREDYKCDGKGYKSEDEMTTSSVTARRGEEMYAKVHKQGGGSFTGYNYTDGHKGTSENENGVETTLAELYAKVDKRGGKLSNEAGSVSTYMGEELYAEVSKQRDLPSKGNGFIDGQQGTSENENGAEIALAELYAKVDKREEKLSNEAGSVSPFRGEEQYAEVSQRDLPSKGSGFINGQQGTSENENGVGTALDELYAKVDKGQGNLSIGASSVSSFRGEELYAKVSKQRDRHSKGNGFGDGQQGTSENENGAETALDELYANVDKKEGNLSIEASSVSSFRGEELYAEVSKQTAGAPKGNGFNDGHQGTSGGQNDAKNTLAELYENIDAKG
ncbi:uncharacterized protein [Diadema setosum]|uniref:uncharacterized protein n=1 Tax=Diadema setosum TaxID=31175 RepID=UPI003B3AB4A7